MIMNLLLLSGDIIIMKSRFNNSVVYSLGIDSLNLTAAKILKHRMAYKRIGAATDLFFFILCHGDICNAQQYCRDYKQNPDIGSDDDDYHLHRVLKEGLANDFKNLYNIQKANLKQKSESKIACLSVNFELQCIPNHRNCSLQVKAHEKGQCSSDINGTKTEFLWSSFDTSSFFGSLLLTYTVYDLRAFGFGWEDDCELYQASINISIAIDEIPCVTKDELCTALQYITTLVCTLCL